MLLINTAGINLRVTTDRRRLAALAGQDCPLCVRMGRSAGLFFNGTILVCENAHAWHNPAAAEMEIQEATPGVQHE